MKPDLYTIGVYDTHKAEKLVSILDDMGILVSSKCKCITTFGKKRCQYGSDQLCKEGYIVMAPIKDREVMISVANAVDII